MGRSHFEAETRLPHPSVETGPRSEGYSIQLLLIHGHPCLEISAASGAGLLYGSFGLLELLRLGTKLEDLPRNETPAMSLRVWDLWDNQDGSIERGYAGLSVFDWADLPAIKPRYRDYGEISCMDGFIDCVICLFVVASA